MDKVGVLKGGDLMEWLLVLEGLHSRFPEEITGSYEDNGCRAEWLSGCMHPWEETPRLLCASHFRRLV